MFELFQELRGTVAFAVTKAGTVRTKTEIDYQMKVCGDCPIIALAKERYKSTPADNLRALEHVRVSSAPAYWRNLDAAAIGLILLKANPDDVQLIIHASDRRNHPLRGELLAALGIGDPVV